MSSSQYQRRDIHAGRRDSTLEVNKTSFYPLAIKLSSDKTSSHLRFFGKETDKPTTLRYIVKKPRLAKEGQSIKEIAEAYQDEQCIWNVVYPERNAELFLDGEPRLVLPRLPGIPLSQSIKDDDSPLLCCKRALAVAKALEDFEKRGYCYDRLTNDKVLLEEKGNNFRAHLIGFGSAHKISEERPNPNVQWTFLNALVYGIPELRCRDFDSFKSLTTALVKEIERLDQEETMSFIRKNF